MCRRSPARSPTRRNLAALAQSELGEGETSQISGFPSIFRLLLEYTVLVDRNGGLYRGGPPVQPKALRTLAEGGGAGEWMCAGRARQAVANKMTKKERKKVDRSQRLQAHEELRAKRLSEDDRKPVSEDRFHGKAAACVAHPLATPPQRFLPCCIVLTPQIDTMLELPRASHAPSVRIRSRRHELRPEVPSYGVPIVSKRPDIQGEDR